MATCPEGSQIQSMRAQVENLDRTWSTTGYYTWQELQELIPETIKLAGIASQSAINFFSQSSTDEMKARVRAASDSYNKIAAQALDYVQTWQKAKQTGSVINAPGLRTWVIKDLRAAVDLMRAVELAQCDSPWWLSAVSGFFGVFIGITNIAQRIGRVVVKAGEVVLDAVETGFSLWPIVKWGAVGLGALMIGVWAWNKLEGASQAGRRSINWSLFNPISRVKSLVRKPSPPVAGYRRRRLRS